jgi:hypothetical protein
MTRQKRENVGKPLPVDWESVKAFWLQSGRDYAATSEAYGIKRNTLAKRFSRDSEKGKALTTTAALKKIERAKKELAEVAWEDPRQVTLSPVDAFENQKQAFMGGMSQGLSRAASFIGSMTGEEVVAGSREVKNIMDSGKALYMIGGETSSASVSINLLNMDASMLAGQVKVIPTE